MGTILPTTPTREVLTPEQRLARQIDTEIKNAARAQKEAYDNVRRLLYGTTQNPKTEEQINANYVAFATHTATGLTPTQLGQMARLSKASINLFNDVKIIDEVPEAIVSFE